MHDDAMTHAKCDAVIWFIGKWYAAVVVIFYF